MLGGGTDGNEQLTAATGVVLLLLLAVIGVTILRIRQLISVHLFVGFVLLGPVLLKMGSTGYRFARYYTGDHAYRIKGAPKLPLRLIAPFVVISTVVVFVSGVVLVIDGPSRREPALLIHKASFLVWIVCTGLHVLAYLPGLSCSLRPVRPTNLLPSLDPGRAGRAIALLGALIGGLVLAIVLISQFGPWTAPGAFDHHGA